MMPSKRMFGVAAAMLVAGLQTAAAVELPTRKSGLWEMKMLPSADMPGMTMQHCTDETTDKRMSDAFMPMAKNMCSKNETQRTAAGYVTDSICTFAGITSVSRAETIGDFNSAFTVKTTSKMQNAPKSIPSDSVSTIEAKWLGACTAGQKPGDIMMPGGMKMNIKDFEKMKGLLPK